MYGGPELEKSVELILRGLELEKSTLEVPKTWYAAFLQGIFNAGAVRPWEG